MAVRNRRDMLVGYACSNETEPTQPYSETLQWFETQPFDLYIYSTLCNRILVGKIYKVIIILQFHLSNLSYTFTTIRDQHLASRANVCLSPNRNTNLFIQNRLHKKTFTGNNSFSGKLEQKHSVCTLYT